MKLEEPARQNLENRNFWQYAKHADSYSDLLLARKRSLSWVLRFWNTFLVGNRFCRKDVGRQL